ncbi:MAG TPA: hypothetical protein VFF03_10095 [Rhodocyclaceae bacterium]|nr:hypothetical protein [Rhodocyclaceae bacterium]
MQDLFDAKALTSFPWSPIALWQANLQMLSNLQQSWMQMMLPGKEAMDGGLMKGQWTTAQPLLAAFMPFLPKIEATITPLKKEGGLAGADDASRVTMRLTMPGFGGTNASEILLVDAVVARAAGGEDALRLGKSDLPAALTKKD